MLMARQHEAIKGQTHSESEQTHKRIVQLESKVDVMIQVRFQ